MSEHPAREIITAMQGPVVRMHRKYGGADLWPHERALHRLLVEIWEAHDLVLDDWTARTGPDKPRRRWDRNKLAKPPCVYDYSQFTPPDWEAQFLRQWEAHYDRFHARGRGNPGRSRTGQQLPLEPLHEVYTILRRWWVSLGRKWHPKAPDDAPSHDLGLPHMNLALRLFVLVAQSCRPEYTAQNCLRVTYTFKVKSQRANGAAKKAG